MKDAIRAAAEEKLLIAAHRGTAGGNIPCNSSAAFEAALVQGADILEIDITKSLDDELFVFHPGMEPFHLGSEINITKMTADEVRGLRYVNGDGVETTCGISTLDEVLETFGRRVFINLDKFFDNPKEITDCVRRHNLQDRVVVKFYPVEECFDLLEQMAPDIPCMPFLWNEDDYTDELLERDIRLIGSEVHFSDDDSEIASREYVKKMHGKDLIVWANAIVFNYKTVENAGHSDDISVTGNPDNGWGWLAGRGFDIIQTDWVLPMRTYLNEKGLLYRKK
ncbi:MAG: glycerophosphodiester phosphodiesterase family protein [Acutalibacteraceae bacterium]|jgi:glycerophosphoryl diester phosphodiesterase